MSELILRNLICCKIIGLQLPRSRVQQRLFRNQADQLRVPDCCPVARHFAADRLYHAVDGCPLEVSEFHRDLCLSRHQQPLNALRYRCPPRRTSVRLTRSGLSVARS